MNEGVEIGKKIEVANNENKLRLQLQQVQIAHQYWLCTHKILANVLETGKLDLDTLSEGARYLIVYGRYTSETVCPWTKVRGK
jgi:hypothetical protein